jgi:hypothetical protein
MPKIAASCERRQKGLKVFNYWMGEGVFGVFGFLFCVVDKNEGVKRELEEKREKEGRKWRERGENLAR